MLTEIIDIWDGLNYDSETDFRPNLTVYIRAGNKPRGCVLILPGGGYGFTSEREAEPIAAQFIAKGYHAAYLDYSVAPDRHPKPLLDALRALTIIMKKSDQWLIDLSEVFIAGFSAGGHLAASVSNFYKDQTYNQHEGIELGDLNLKGVILSYPVISGGPHRHEGSFTNLLGDEENTETREQFSMENCVHSKTPPTFIWHTFADDSVPVENSLLYGMALKKEGIPFEMHIFPEGGHGLSLATEETAVFEEQVNAHVANWIELCHKWMAQSKQ